MPENQATGRRVARPRRRLEQDIADPRGGTEADWDRALDLVEAGCAAL